MTRKYFYTQDYDDSNIKYLDVYCNGIWKTIVSFETVNNLLTIIEPTEDLEDRKAVRAFAEYFSDEYWEWIKYRYEEYNYHDDE